MSGIKRLRKYGDLSFIGNENGEVTINQERTVRVTINGEDTVWEIPTPGHKWDFEESSGNYIDSINEKILTDTDIAQRVTSMHAELGQAIELDSGFEVLTSKPYPALVEDGVEFNIDATKSNLQPAPIDGASFTVDVVYSNLREPIIEEDLGSEGVAFIVDVVSSDLRIPLISYDDGVPEGTSFSVDVVSSDLRVVALPYEEGDPEGAEFSIDVVSSNLY